jgi:iron complex outermembrane receptor protein
VHQGVEAGLDSTLWEQPGTGKLSLRQAYTFSDFHTATTTSSATTACPASPCTTTRPNCATTGRAVLRRGEYADGLKVQVDYANSYPADAYALLGARLGWDSPKRDWQTWLDLRNLTDKRYAATVTPGYDDGGKDVARSTPGEGFAAYLGVSYSFR